MRSLFIAGLRLFILLNLLQDVSGLMMFTLMEITSGYIDIKSALQYLFTGIGSMLFYVLVLWKAPWIADKLKIETAENAMLPVDANTIVACGLILFGIFGIAEQVIRSLDFFNYFFSGSFMSAPPSFGPGGPIEGAIFFVVRFFVFLYCIFGAKRIAEMTTNKLANKS